MLKGGDSSAVIEPGLPNVTGNFGYYNSRFISQANGVFSGIVATNTGFGIANSNAPDETLTYSRASLSLSSSNSVYGSSNTVQPPALCLIPQIKY